jgi:hypothetical protein
MAPRRLVQATTVTAPASIEVVITVVALKTSRAALNERIIPIMRIEATYLTAPKGV